MTTHLRHKPQVTHVPPAPAAEAIAHFAAKLALEADPADVHFDMQHGVANFVLLDARKAQQFEECRIPGAHSLPHRRISAKTTAEFDKTTLIVTYCWGPGCNAATQAALKLAELGFPVKEMIGGLEYWRREGHPVDGTLGNDAPLVG